MIKGMIFAAGLGTRLRPLTDRVPKAMVEVGGIPMLRRVIDRMAEAGVEEIVVNVHHLADVVTGYLDAVRGELPTPVAVSDERGQLLDTGGGLLYAGHLLEGATAIVVHNADILTDAPLAPMIGQHLAAEADATLLVDSCRESSRRLMFDDKGRLHGRINLKTGATTPASLDMASLSAAAFGGVHVVNPRIFHSLGRYGSEYGPVFSITDFYCQTAEELDIRSFEAGPGTRWFDMGRPESLAAARALFD